MTIKVHDLLDIVEKTLREYLSYELAKEVREACEGSIVKQHEKLLRNTRKEDKA